MNCIVPFVCIYLGFLIILNAIKSNKFTATQFSIYLSLDVSSSPTYANFYGTVLSIITIIITLIFFIQWFSDYQGLFLSMCSVFFWYKQLIYFVGNLHSSIHYKVGPYQQFLLSVFSPYLHFLSFSFTNISDTF